MIQKTTPETTHLSVSTSDSATLQKYLEVLRLGTIDIIQNPTIWKIIGDSISQNYYQDRLSFSYLKEYYSTISQGDLELEMSNSIINNGGNAYQVSILPSIIDSFTIGNYRFRPVLNIPYSDGVNLQQHPYLGINWITPLSTIMLTGYPSLTVKGIRNNDQNFVMTNPTVLVTFRVKNLTLDEWETAMPWKRCSCKPNDGNPGGDPNPSDPQDGSCGADYDGSSCGRADMMGNCPGGDCQMDGGVNNSNQVSQMQRLVFN